MLIIDGRDESKLIDGLVKRSPSSKPS